MSCSALEFSLHSSTVSRARSHSRALENAVWSAQLSAHVTFRTPWGRLGLFTRPVCLGEHARWRVVWSARELICVRRERPRLYSYAFNQNSAVGRRFETDPDWIPTGLLARQIFTAAPSCITTFAAPRKTRRRWNRRFAFPLDWDASEFWYVALIPNTLLQDSS